jgi:hypothetical protein
LEALPHLIACTPKTELKRRAPFIAELSDLQQNALHENPMRALVVPILAAPQSSAAASADVKSKAPAVPAPPAAPFDLAKARALWLMLAADLRMLRSLFLFLPRSLWLFAD